MSDFKTFVDEFIKIIDEGKKIEALNIVKNKNLKTNKKALLFSPHPDDECLIGALPLRLLKELNIGIINVAVTLGSNISRKEPRKKELINACNYLNFDLILPEPLAFDGVNLNTRNTNKEKWQKMVLNIANILVTEKPLFIFFPHKNDFNSTHIGTYYLLIDALKSLNNNFKTFIFFTEYWHQMARPNILVESIPQDIVQLVTATSLHVGEVARNPYHISLPSLMHDNIRRGSELIGGQGQNCSNAYFGTLYGLRLWKNGHLVNCLKNRIIIKEDSSSLKEFVDKLENIR